MINTGYTLFEVGGSEKTNGNYSRGWGVSVDWKMENGKKGENSIQATWRATVIQDSFQSLTRTNPGCPAIFIFFPHNFYSLTPQSPTSTYIQRYIHDNISPRLSFVVDCALTSTKNSVCAQALKPLDYRWFGARSRWRPRRGGRAR